MMFSLTSIAVPRTGLKDEEVRSMFRLFHEYFHGAEREVFVRDLGGKDWVILLSDGESGELVGFSTLALYTTRFDGRPLTVVFSGDTIVRPDYWRTPELSRSWIRTVLEKSAGMPQPLYWLLISSGYKTYRFLSVFYKEYFPRYDRPTPPEARALIDQLATHRFGSDYRPAEGIVRFEHGATPLRAGIAEVTDRRLTDPHVAFFIARNPGHASGDELVCLTRVHPDNLTPAGRRMLR